MKPPTVFLGEMTNPEVEAFVKKNRMVIVPTGAVEQHGPHGPLLTDVLIPNEVARRAAPKLGAAVAPPISYALSYPHKGFTSVVYLRMETFRMLVEDIAIGLATMGFKRIVFLNGHYDNTYALAYACASAAPAARRRSPWCSLNPRTLRPTTSQCSHLSAQRSWDIGPATAFHSASPTDCASARSREWFISPRPRATCIFESRRWQWRRRSCDPASSSAAVLQKQWNDRTKALNEEDEHDPQGSSHPER